MNDIKHIFFDLDHTLWDFEKNSKLALQQIFEEQGFALSFQDFLQVYIPINLAYWDKFTKQEVTREQLRYGRLRDSFNSLNFNIADDIIYQISDDYINYLPNNNYLLPGAKLILDYLKPKYKLHIITNGFDMVQRKKIQRSGLQPYFDVIVTSDSLGIKKPDPKIFKHALEMANAIAENSVMIGDNYNADIIGAFKVGMQPIHIKSSNSIENHNFVSVNRLEDIKQYL